MAKRKKYNPVKEAAKVTGITASVLLGRKFAYDIAGQVSGGHEVVGPSVSLMSNIPTVSAGGSVLRSLEMLNVKTKKKRKK